MIVNVLILSADFYEWLFCGLPNLPILSQENVLYGMSVKESSHDLIVSPLIILGHFLFIKIDTSSRNIIFTFFIKNSVIIFQLCKLVEEFHLAEYP